MTETNSEMPSKPISISGGKRRRRGLPGLQIEINSERVLEMLATGEPITGALRSELQSLATEIHEMAKELNERVMATGTYAEVG